MGQFATGVSIITVGSDNELHTGVTINSLCSVSLDPPMILFCLKRHAHSYVTMMANPYFVVNILAKEQIELLHLCTSRGGGILKPEDFDINSFGVPVLKKNLATIECEKDKIYPGGDHTIILGKVLNLDFCDRKTPLVFHRSHFTTLDTANVFPTKKAV